MAIIVGGDFVLGNVLCVGGKSGQHKTPSLQVHESIKQHACRYDTMTVINWGRWRQLQWKPTMQLYWDL